VVAFGVLVSCITTSAIDITIKSSFFPPCTKGYNDLVEKKNIEKEKRKKVASKPQAPPPDGSAEVQVIKAIDHEALHLNELRHIYSDSQWTKTKLRKQIQQAWNSSANLPQHLTKTQLVEILVCYMRNMPVPVFKKENKWKKQPSEPQDKSKKKSAPSQPVTKRKVAHTLSQPQNIDTARDAQVKDDNHSDDNDAGKKGKKRKEEQAGEEKEEPSGSCLYSLPCIRSKLPLMQYSERRPSER